VTTNKTEREVKLDSLERHALYYGYRVMLEKHSPEEEKKSRAELRAQAERRLLAESLSLYEYDSAIHPAEEA
jgi:hypothetical protein